MIINNEENEAIEKISALQTMHDIAQFLGTSKQKLLYHLFKKPLNYRTFNIPKKTGGLRKIESPAQPISFFQKKLAEQLQKAYRRKTGVFGFCKQGGIVKNAKEHINAKIILNLDLKDFFQTITFPRVYGFFKSRPFALPHKSATVLARLCCSNEGYLPQGAPTSPIISNYICRGLDAQLHSLAIRFHCKYTRYADDITFSTKKIPFPTQIITSITDNEVQLGNELVSIIENNNFKINYNKVRARKKFQRQEVTGITVNDKINVKKEFYRDIRAALNDWKRNGYDHAQDNFLKNFNANGKLINFSQHLQGKLEFLKQVRGDGDYLYARYALQYIELAIRDKKDYKPFILSGNAALDNKLVLNTIWIVCHMDNERNIWVNGTGFSTDQGIVTNFHVASSAALDESAPPCELYVINGNDKNSTPYRAKIIKQSEMLDLAILSIEETTNFAILKISESKSESAEKIRLIGYPHWDYKIPVSIENGQIINNFIKSNLNLIQITPKIRDGHSGAPVINSKGEVVGVATYSEESALVKNSAISVQHIAELK